MEIASLADGRYILWGANWSLYSAKVRPYLIKKGIDYLELNPSHPHFHESVVPRIGHITLPVIESPDGAIVADSTEIMEYFESRSSEKPMVPRDRIMAALAWLLHNFGSEGLLKSAMHYRWNTLEDNRPFIVDEFSRSLQVKEELDQADKAMGRTYAEHIWDYLPYLGVADQHTEIIERSTRELYELLNAHFLEYPYLLGGSPSIADCGLMGPLYAHLGRDPASNVELKLKAPALYRWIETMGRAQETDPELWYVPSGYFCPDELPQTLLALLGFMARDYGPEMVVAAEAYAQWLPGKQAGDIVSHDGEKANHQILGMVEHQQQGGTVKHGAFLDVLTLHQHVIEVVAQMPPDQLSRYKTIMNDVGAEAICALALPRAMVRRDYAWVLA